MIDLFGSDGLAALERLTRAKTLYAFDFDGTLAPIVDHPDRAAAGASTVSRLGTLGALVPTAIVTGRRVADMRARIEFTPLHLIGDHGAEGLPDGLHRSLADSVGGRGETTRQQPVDEWLAQWPDVIGPLGRDPGIVVEPKNHSISVHYRMAADQGAAERAIREAIGRLQPAPRVIGGKCVVNLLAEGAPDKGTALLALARFEHCSAAFFIGDDLTDEAAFVQAPKSWVTVRVGRADDSAARYFIEQQSDIDRCLDRLIANAEAAAFRRP